MQPLDLQYWEKYAHEHRAHYNHEMAKFISDLATSLRANSVLEVGCSAGNDLMLFGDQMRVFGIDDNEYAILKAMENLPHFEFKIGSATSIPYEDSSFDFVFARNLLNYVEDWKVQKAVNEMFRVSKKYVVNIELFSENDTVVESSPIKTTGRNMKKIWLDYKVKIISDVEMHEEIDPKKSRFVLIRKM